MSHLAAEIGEMFGNSLPWLGGGVWGPQKATGNREEECVPQCENICSSDQLVHAYVWLIQWFVPLHIPFIKTLDILRCNTQGVLSKVQPTPCGIGVNDYQQFTVAHWGAAVWNTARINNLYSRRTRSGGNRISSIRSSLLLACPTLMSRPAL